MQYAVNNNDDIVLYNFFRKTSELQVPTLNIKIKYSRFIFCPQCSYFDLFPVLFVFENVCKYENPFNLVEILQFLQCSVEREISALI